METRLGRLPCRVERPEPQKFAWPIVLLPEFFTTVHHLAVMLGYLATIGWEVYAPDLRAVAGHDAIPPLGAMGFADLIQLASEALDALEGPAVVIGHGLGGLLALKLAETRQLKAAVALAPLVPGSPNPLVSGWSKLPTLWLQHPLKPPTGRTLFEFLLDVEAFQRPAMVKALVADASQAAREVVSGRVSFASRPDLPPRLIVAGEVDTFAPLEKVKAFADSIGAATVVARGRGHWLIGGRGLERTIGEAHRFLVRSLGQDLLLLFPEEWKSEPNDGESSG
ncbi:MAG TPA: alpha/beta fold hydrolase [Candidatus Binataceae bacterium]|nr:alpha/beta fold hydrolase [Candidatus Binataceae bacterium]